MANSKGLKITAAMIITIVLIGAGVLANYVRTDEKLDTTIKRVDKLEPEVKLNTEARTTIQADMVWIKGSLKRIEAKP